MDALKRSLAQQEEAKPAPKPRRARALPIDGNPAMLLPVSGGRRKKDDSMVESLRPVSPKRRKKA